MKKNLIAKLMVAALACTALMGQAVYADDNDTEIPVETSVEAEEEETVEEAEAIMAQAKEAAYTVINGTVTAVTVGEDESISIQIDGDNAVIAHLSETTYVFDADRATEAVSAQDIEEGMEVSLIIPANAPMAMSYPAQISSVAVVVISGEMGNFDVSVYNEDLVNAEGTLALNIGEETAISDITGARRVFTAEDVKNSESIVFYTASTRSIPAQTTPSVVFILDVTESVTAVPAAEEEVTEIILNAEGVVRSVQLRETAEAAGYTVTWTANDEPIVLENGEVTIEVVIGTANYTVDGETIELSVETELRNGVTYVSNEIFE